MGSKTHKFGIQALRRMFAIYIMIEKKRCPLSFEACAKKMGTIAMVAMLNNNYVQIDNNDRDDKEDEYHGI